MFSEIDVLIGADVFYDPIVAETFITDVVLPLLTRTGKTAASASAGAGATAGTTTAGGRRTTTCLASTSIRSEQSWLNVLQMLQRYHLQWNIITSCPCPWGTSARVEIANISF